MAFCKKEGYERVLGFSMSGFRELGVPSVFMMGTQNVAEVWVEALGGGLGVKKWVVVEVGGDFV